MKSIRDTRSYWKYYESETRQVFEEQVQRRLGSRHK